MSLNQVTIESENPLGSLPVYVSSGLNNIKKLLIVIINK